MKSIRKTLWMATLVITLVVWACVTINIYFPAEKVESVAGEIVSEVRGQKAEDQDGDKEKDNSKEVKKRFLEVLRGGEGKVSTSDVIEYFEVTTGRRTFVLKPRSMGYDIHENGSVIGAVEAQKTWAGVIRRDSVVEEHTQLFFLWLVALKWRAAQSRYYG